MSTVPYRLKYKLSAMEANDKRKKENICDFYGYILYLIYDQKYNILRVRPYKGE